MKPINELQPRQVPWRNRIINVYEGGDTTAEALPIVLVHGTAGTAAKHFGLLQPLLSAKFHTISFDWQDTGADTPLEIEDIAEQIELIVRETAGGRPVTLVGYSLGAAAAVAAAARMSETVANLVTIAGWITSDNYQKLRNRIWTALRREESDALADFQVFCALGSPFIANKPWHLVQGAIDAVTTASFIDRQMDLNRRVDLEDVVSAVQSQTLVIGGRYDQMVPFHHSRMLFGAIPNARLVQLDAGHAVLQERMAELVQLIGDFASSPARHPAGSILERPNV